jgi:hypothetical protein
MRKLAALVILAAAIAGAITLMSAEGFNDFVQWITLWTSTEIGRHVLTATITITGILGWAWGFRLWRRRLDAARQIQVLQEKLVTLPNMMTRVFVPYFNFLMRSSISKLPAKDQQGVVTRLQGAIEVDGRTQALVPSQFAPPMRFEESRLPFGAPKQTPHSDEAFRDLLATDLPRHEATSLVKLAPEEEALFEDQIGQIVRHGIDRSLRGIGIRNREVEHY